MIVIVCLDTACGMMFAHRRLSRDCEVTRRIQTICKGKKLWMNSYSARLYGDLKETHVLVKEDFLSYAKKGEFCLVAYPADLHFDLDLAKWKKSRRCEFPGNSHDLITEEYYIRNGEKNEKNMETIYHTNS